MSNNTQLPAEAGLHITRAAIEYANQLPFFSNEIRDAWDAGATAYATKLHQEQIKSAALDVLLDTCGDNYEALKATYAQAQALLKKVIYRHEGLLIILSAELYN